jgi:hypothetical protein
MKTLTSIISMLLIFAFFGCTENQLTQPETAFNNSAEKKSSTEIPTYQIIKKDKLKLCCKVCDPVTGYCKLIGKVIYTHTTLSNIGGYARVQISFDMKSELHTPLMNFSPYFISGCSCDTVYINEMGVSFVEKNYEVRNRMDVRLGVKYKVTIDGAEIIGIRLHQIDQG